MAIEITYTHSNGVRLIIVDKEGWRSVAHLSWEDVEELYNQRQMQKKAEQLNDVRAFNEHP